MGWPDDMLQRPIADTRERVRAAIASSVLGRTARGLRRAVYHSYLAQSVRTLARWIRHSYLYRWFTTEPDPDIIVIDLRETYTIGPFLRLFDWVGGGLARRYRGSIVQRAVRYLTSPVVAGGRYLAGTRVGRALIRAFEVPEPNERREDSER